MSLLLFSLKIEKKSPNAIWTIVVIIKKAVASAKPIMILKSFNSVVLK
jgi:hypothetical protein